MHLLIVFLAAAATLEPVGALDVKTIVNNVPWWPESNLQFEEAVGVVSRGVLFATGMLEASPIAPGPHFNSSQLNLELLDLHDIVVAANTSLSSLVDCVVNVPAGAAVEAKHTLEKALGGAANAPCITVMETKGEDPDDYPGYMYNSSISCYAAVKAKGESKISRHQFNRNGTEIRVVDQGNGMMWLNAEASGDSVAATSGFWGEIESALAHTDRSTTLSDLVDCTVFVPPGTKDGVIKSVQRAVAHSTSSNGKYVAAQLTAVKVSVGGSKTKLRCTALVGGRTKKRRYQAPGANSTSVVVAGGFAYVSGVGSTQPNATDGFHDIGRALKAAGSRLNLVLHCFFWVSSQSVIEPFFHGFHDVFNRDSNNKTAAGFPPPSRNEFVGSSVQSQCSSRHCPVLSKCVAAMPAPEPTGYSCNAAEQVCKLDRSSRADKASCEHVCPP
jgi:hypothetical protein